MLLETHYNPFCKFPDYFVTSWGCRTVGHRRSFKSQHIVHVLRIVWEALAVPAVMNEEPSLADEIIMALIDGEVVDSFLV
jgi:hypothetical protein